jgi:site-specific recombinase XerC
MLASLFKYPAVLARHRNAPLLEERERYLQHRAEQGCAPCTLLCIARELLHVIQLLDIHPTSAVTAQQIEVAAKIWARSQCRRGRAHTFRWSRRLFVQVATDWLRFLGLLDEPVLQAPPFVEFTEQFSEWLNIERGLSTATIFNYSWHANQFLQWCQDYNLALNTIQASDVDTFLISRSEKGWCRVSIATCAKALKAFFLYAEQRSWCQPLIARAVQGPRLFPQETLPSGPSWDEVNHIIDTLAIKWTP